MSTSGASDPAEFVAKLRTSTTIAAAAVVVVIVAIVMFQFRGAESPAVTVPIGRDTSAIAAGPVHIRSVHSGLCLSEHPERDTGELFQAPCAGLIIPRQSVVPFSDGTYQVTTIHPRFDVGCMGVLAGNRQAGAAMADESCGWRRDAERFRFEPVTAPLTGYRIVVVQSGLCAEVPASSAQVWAPVRQMACDTGSRAQVFAFDPA